MKTQKELVTLSKTLSKLKMFDELVGAAEQALAGWRGWVKSELEGTSSFKGAMRETVRVQKVVAKARALVGK